MVVDISQARQTALQELQSLRVWAVWRYETDDKGKRTKRPYNCHTGGGASSTKPATWTSYQHACRKLKTGHDYYDGTHRDFDGIGFFNNGDYVFLDWDHCRDQETGIISEIALRQIQAINSYTEISVSDTGIHSVARGSIPAAVKRPEIEMYPRDRFFTFSGNHLEGTPETIEDRHNELETLYQAVAPPPVEKKKRAAAQPSHDPLSLDDNALLEAAHNAKNGARFAALWRGDTSSYGGDESRADQALCNMLAFWTDNDPARIDNLFRKSGLNREKWDREDYRDRTINHAIDITVDTYHATKKPEPEEEIEETADGVPPTNLDEALAQIAQLQRKNAALEKQNALQGEVIQIVKVKVDAQWEKETTRLLAIKTALIALDRVEKKQQKTLYEPFRLTITSGVNPQNNKPYKGLAEVLNFNRKTIGEAYKTLHKAGQIVQFERNEEHGERTHYEYQLTPLIASHDHACLDKKPGVPRAKQQKKQKQFETVPVAAGLTCEDCASPNINIICRDCGSVTSLYGEHECSPAPESEPCVKFTHSVTHSTQESEENLHIPFEQKPVETNETNQESVPAQKTPDLSHLPEEIAALCQSHNLTPAKPCSKCGCPLHTRLDDCARCAPLKSPTGQHYKEYGEALIDRYYPPQKHNKILQFGEKSHAA